MAVGRTTYSDISPAVEGYAVRKALEHAQPVMVLSRFGTPLTVPRNKSQTIKWRRPVPFSAATTPLVEGVTPPPTKMAYDIVTATLKQYGDWSEITDVIQDTHTDPVLNEMTMLHGENMGATHEQLLYGVLKGGTTVFYANNVSGRSSVVDVLSLNDVRRVVRYLRAQKAQFFTNVLDASVKVSTKPIERSYIAVCHTDLEADIRSISGFVSTAEYGQRSLVSEHEIGTIENVRFVISPELAPFADAGGTTGAGTTRLSTSGSNCDVYPILFFGRGAFTVTPLRGPLAARILVTNPDKATKDDPLAQRGTVGWKTWFTAARTNETWMARLEVAATRI